MTTQLGSELSKAVAAALDAWSPPPRISVSEWAGRYRHLSLEASADPGLWLNSRAPHLIAPMDALGPYHPAERVVCKFSSQTGKTEIMLNMCGFVIDIDPGPILCIQPNVQPMGETFSKNRIVPMLRDSPTLSKKCGPAKSRSSASTITQKSFPGGHLTIAGANSAAGLASRPIRYLFGDEIDRWEPTKEGDPLSLARKRQQLFRARRSAKELLVSSPTYDDIGISVEYANCSSKYEWHLACTHCGATQFPHLDHFRHDGDPSELRYVCGHCGGEHALHAADKIKKSGRWVCTKNGGDDSIGFWMNQWASPFARWDDTLKEWLDAGTDALKRQVVVNTAFAQPWEGTGEKIDPEILYKRAEDWTDNVPAGVVGVTVGVDCQIDRLEVEIVGWGEKEESWSLDYQVLAGEPTGTQVWLDLLELIDKPILHPSGAILKPAMTCVDSGNWARPVYAFVQKSRNPRIVPIKGASPFNADPIHGSRKDRKRRAMKRMREGKPPEIIGVSQIKRVIAKYLAGGKDDHGYCHFPAGRGKEYYDQLTGERLVVEKKRGKRAVYAWQKIHPNVEALDCRVYAYAALLLSDIDLSRKPMPAKKRKPAEQRSQKTAPKSGPRPRLIR